MEQQQNMKASFQSIIPIGLISLMGLIIQLTAIAESPTPSLVNLSAILQQAEQVKAEGETPVAVFDLDSTLFNNAPRTRRILFEATQADPTLAAYAETIQHLSDDLPYSIADTLTLAGITDEEARARFSSFWSARFFAGEHCIYDKPTPGAVDLVTTLHKAGVTIIYLTSRSATRMATGTTQSLLQNGFPVMQTTAILLMKPDSGQNHTKFKQNALKTIEKLGKVILTAENESKNANLFAEKWPDAAHFYLKTSCNPKKIVPLHENIIQIDDFR